jgi:hypothetical protein
MGERIARSLLGQRRLSSVNVAAPGTGEFARRVQQELRGGAAQLLAGTADGGEGHDGGRDGLDVVVPDDGDVPVGSIGPFRSRCPARLRRHPGNRRPDQRCWHGGQRRGDGEDAWFMTAG